MSFSSRQFLDTREHMELNPEAGYAHEGMIPGATRRWQDKVWKDYLDRIGQDRANELEKQYQQWLQHRSPNG